MKLIVHVLSSKMVNRIYFFIILMTLVCVVFGEENKKNDEEIQRESREVDLENIYQDWKAVDETTPQSQEWLAIHFVSDEETTPKILKRRRRIRKRKRRPQLYTTTDPTQEVSFDSFRDQIRPQRLDQVDDSWIEMNEELLKRPYSRRRTTPKYPENESNESFEKKYPMEQFDLKDAIDIKNTNSPTIFFEKVRDPFTALEEDERLRKKHKQSEIPKVPDIKSILKKTGSVSLSEVLQKKNLTLSDLLMGNEKAISALTDPLEITHSEPIKEYKNPVEDDFFDLPFFLTQNSENTKPIKTKEVPDSTEILSPLKENHGSDNNNKNITTNSSENITLTKDFAVLQNKTSSLKKHIHSLVNTAFQKSKNALPINAELSKNITNKHTKLKYTLPDGFPATNNIIEAVLTNIQEEHEAEKQAENLTQQTLRTKSDEEGPFRMSINIDGLVKKNSDYTPLPNKLEPISAREEIMEMMNDPVTRTRLSRILEIRNMTLDELVELRERGSSKRHLADIFHSRSKEPEPPKEPFLGKIELNNKTDSFLFVERKPKSNTKLFYITKNNSTSQEILNQNHTTSSSVSDINSSTETYTATYFPTFKIYKNVSSEQGNNKVSWKNIVVTKVIANNENDDVNLLPSKNIEDVLQNDLRRIDEIENKVSESFQDQLQVDVKHDYFDLMDNKFQTIHNGITSAVFASLSITGVSLFVFLTIMIVFKWSKKKSNQRNIIHNFSEYKGKGPTIKGSLRKTIKTLMSDTLSRKFRNSNMLKTNVLENEWNRKPYQSVSSH